MLKIKFGMIVVALLLLASSSLLYAAQVPESLKNTEKFALRGDAAAQYLMGRHYLKAGKPKDYLEAEKWFRLSAKQGNTKAIYGLGWILSRKAETIDDEIEIAKLYRRAADKGDMNAQYALGLYILNSKADLKRDINAAATLFQKAAAQNHLLANATLVAMAHKNECDISTGKKSLEKIKKWAKRGIASAQYELGRIIEYGYIVQLDYTKAMIWYKKAAPKGMIKAYTQMGYLYESGLGIPKDYKKAMQSYKAAADKGDFTANFNIAQMYEKGLGVEKNDKKAVNSYAKAAMFGHLKSMSRYGIMRAEGRGIKKNDAAAATWLMQAAAFGDVDAQYYLGFMYQKGRIDVEIDKQDQQKRWVKLFRGRYHDAELHSSHRASIYWYEKAAAQGHEKAIAQLERDKNLTGWFTIPLGVFFLLVSIVLFIWPHVTSHNPFIIRFVSAPLIFITGVAMLQMGLKAFGWIG